MQFLPKKNKEQNAPGKDKDEEVSREFYRHALSLTARHQLLEKYIEEAKKSKATAAELNSVSILKMEERFFDHQRELRMLFQGSGTKVPEEEKKTAQERPGT